MRTNTLTARLIIGFALILFCTNSAHAGMPSFRLTDMGSARLQTISFFLVAFLILSACVQGLWNYLRHDFDRLPRLSYPRALALVGIWSLLFVLVLTMISGARELLTPGAWEKQGSTYQIKTSAGVTP